MLNATCQVEIVGSGCIHGGDGFVSFLIAGRAGGSECVARALLSALGLVSWKGSELLPSRTEIEGTKRGRVGGSLAVKTTD